MLHVEFRTAIEAPWTGIAPVCVGAAPIGAPAAYVTVEADGAPELRIDIFEAEPACHAFQDAIEWGPFAVIGFGAHVHFVSLATRTTTTVALRDYFGHLYAVDDRLLVADAEGLHCFDRNAALLWSSAKLGIDGVVVHDVADGVVSGDGEWDPPGGWRPFRISIASGDESPITAATSIDDGP